MEKGQQQKEEFSTEVGQLDEALNVLDSSLSHIKWRLKAAARRRLQIGTLFHFLTQFRFWGFHGFASFHEF